MNKQAYFELGDGSIIRTNTPEYWQSDKRLPATVGKARLAEQSKARLLEILQPGDTVHCVLRHVSTSGMSRRIDLFKLVDGEAVFVSEHAANVTGYTLSDKGGLVVGGRGMDMGFHIVETLGRCLFRDGWKCIGKGCPHSSHVNGAKTRKGTKHDSGYTLRSQWM